MVLITNGGKRKIETEGVMEALVRNARFLTLLAAFIWLSHGSNTIVTASGECIPTNSACTGEGECCYDDRCIEGLCGECRGEGAECDDAEDCCAADACWGGHCWEE
jgi:hypothetical protein